MRWSEAQLRWFLGDKSFHNDPWWEELDENGKRKPGTFDGKNRDVAIKPGGKLQLLPLPYFWEVLRRHPQIPELRRESARLFSHSDLSPSPLERWQERWIWSGGRAISAVVNFGSFHWVELEDVRKNSGERVKDDFVEGLYDFLSSNRNYATSKRYYLPRPVSDPPKVWPPESDWLYESPPVYRKSLDSIEDLKAHLRNFGRRLIVLDVDGRMPQRKLKEEIWEAAKGQLERGDSNGSLREDSSEQRDSKNTIQLTQAKYQALAQLNSKHPLTQDELKNLRNIFGDFSLH
jgi:hypothetical protein